MTNKIIVVTGFESTGSVFVAKVISYVSTIDISFGEWSGYGLNRKRDGSVAVLHRSLPFGRKPKKWLIDIEKELEDYEGYDVFFVICTRDLNISRLSRISRFGGDILEYQNDDDTVRSAVNSLYNDEAKMFVFSYESALALGAVYFYQLYGWLGFKSDFQPPMFDANIAYIKSRPLIKLPFYVHKILMNTFGKEHRYYRSIRKIYNKYIK